MPVDRGARNDVRQMRAFQKLATRALATLGIVAGNGISLDFSTDTISVRLTTNSGLKFTTGALGIALDTNSGLVLGAGGLKILLNPTNPGLILTASGLAILPDPDANNRLTVSAAGMLVRSPLTSKGDLWGWSSTDARVPVGINGTVLQADNTQALGVRWVALPTVVPGGSTTNVQFNDGGAFGGDVDFSWDKTNNVLILGSSATAASLRIDQSTGSPPATFATLNVGSNSTGVPHVLLTGTATDTSVDTTGGAIIYMTHNGGGNRQLCFGASENFGSFGAAVFRFLCGAGIANIDGVTGSGTTRLPINFGTDTSSIAIGNNALAYNATLPGKLAVYGEASIVGLHVRLGSSGTANLTEWANNAGTVQSSVDSAGNIQTNVAGVGYKCKEGTNATMGVGTLVAGALVVNTTKVTANSRIFVTVQALGGIAAPVGVAVTARTAGTSFTVTSASALDTSTFAWIIVEPS